MSTVIRGNHATAPGLIHDRKDWKATNMSGENVKPGTHKSAGLLNGPDRDKFFATTYMIDYIVYSFATPIAWHYTDGTWYKVSQRWGVTTSKHQGRLYLV